MKTENNKNLKQVYRYWISKADGKIHKDVAYIKTIKVHDKENVIILDSSIWWVLLRSFSQFEKSTWVELDFVWAVRDKIKQAKEQMEHYEEALLKIENEDIREDY